MKYEDSKIWLFSFADLAFLLLIAFTQASTIGKKPVNIGEMQIPKVVDSPNVASINQSAISYQIRVLKPTIPETPPYELVTVTGNQEEIAPNKMTAQELRDKLILMKQNGDSRPILVPDIFSISRDTLMAMSIIEKVYTDANRITVQRISNVGAQ